MRDLSPIENIDIDNHLSMVVVNDHDGRQMQTLLPIVQNGNAVETKSRVAVARDQKTTKCNNSSNFLGYAKNNNFFAIINLFMAAYLGASFYKVMFRFCEAGVSMIPIPSSKRLKITDCQIAFENLPTKASNM